jgi:alpha-tubulin suppressor-like RCC1 family protein
VVQDTINVQVSVPHGAFAQVSVGLSLNTCAVTTQGGGFCWGTLYTTQADSLAAYAKPVYDVPGAVPGGRTWTAFSGGFQHICGLATDGAAYCWGYNSSGQLGNDNGIGSSLAYTPAPVAVTGGLTFQAVSAGSYHTCGLTTSGAIYCWGGDYRGQLGNGTTSYVNGALVAVSGGLTFVAVTVSDDHSCGLTAAGVAYCWGDNGAGELGTGDTVPSTVPVPVTGGLKFVALSAGYAHGCGLTQAGAAYCWGNNGAGELGHGTTVRSTSPVLVSGGLTFASISAGQDYTCGVTTGGAAYCWGDNSYGTLGNSANLFTHNANPTPLPVSGGLTFQTVSAGYLHTCGVTTTGTMYCWGDNSEGELGNGSFSITGASVTPVLVSGP